MKKSLFLFFLSSAMVSVAQDKVLIFSKTKTFRHASIPKGVQTVRHLLDSLGIASLHTEDSGYFTTENLRGFSAVIFLSTTGDLFDDAQKTAFQQYIRSGRGYVGIHAASDTEHNWPWYGGLVGGYFTRHPHVQEAKMDIVDQSHPSTRHLPKVWFHKDEWYDFRDVHDGLNILMTLDETSYDGGQMGKFHPIAWFREYDGGRAFYTGLGHTDESFDVEHFRKHILGGIRYAIGE